MCLVVLAIGQSPEYPLIVAGNRDEFHARSSAAADWWDDKPDILGGRDLEAGGSWLALHRGGRFATVTNFRDAVPPTAGPRSRGHLVTGFLESSAEPREFLEGIDGSDYAGFNLIVGDANSVAYCSNRGAGVRDLEAGVYGLSNALLDGSWDKVRRSKHALGSLLDEESVDEQSLLDLLLDRRPGRVEEAEVLRLGETAARAITAPFIVTPGYGTRCSTVVLRDRDARWRFCERRFDSEGVADGESRFSFVPGG